MSDSKKSRGDDDAVGRAFSEFRLAWLSGKRLDPAEFCKKHPECGHKLQQDIEDFIFVQQGLSRMGQAAEIDLGEGDTENMGILGNLTADFRILREIGKGGMGTVYEAQQISLNRKVALKVLPAHLSFSVEAVQKFRREAEAGGRQSHPGIVAIHAVGCQDGVHYIAQELVEGGYSLSEKLDELKTGGMQPPGYFREVAELVAEIADALEHAHQTGVVHRDIKPSNILLTPEGRPKVTDFGLAKIEDALALSRTGDFAGTPFYMSPEQAMSRRIGIDKRTDIFSLGVTLYEMLTLVRPFQGETSKEVLEKITLVDPEPPNRANPRVPRDLSTICLKAMEKLREKRYQTISEFAEDLRRFLSGDVILAKPASLKTRVWRRIRRRPVLSTGVSVAGVALVALAAVFLWGITTKKEAEAQRKTAEEEITRLLRFADLTRLSDLEHRAEDLWPADPENITRLKDWLSKAEELASHLENHRAVLFDLRQLALPYTEEAKLQDRNSHPRLADLQEAHSAEARTLGRIMFLEEEAKASDSGRAEGTEKRTNELKVLKGQFAGLEKKITALEKEVSERRTFEFADEENQWRHDTLAGLVAGIEQLIDEKKGVMKNVRERLAFAESVKKRSITDFKDFWDETIASIADEEECPFYKGLRIEPIIGFVPIGRDPTSGLWEFAHLQTGEIPIRDTEGRLFLDEKTCLVFVLVPGGNFTMGTIQSPENTDSQNLNFEAENDETPAHLVTLKPFFLSKYEMTQGQWQRITLENPSQSNPDTGTPIWNRKGNPISLLHPVENVSWDDCALLVSRLKLRLPSESEWEYAARAGTTTVYWTGDDIASLQGAANLADQYCKQNGGNASWIYDENLDDGFTVHAPVGSFRPNAFGLHDVCGNVWEWCQDLYGPYKDAPSDGSAALPMPSLGRVYRGGSWIQDAQECRSANRNYDGPDFRYNILGLRPAFSLP